MTNRRQALCSREPLATCIFLSLILVFIFALPSILVRAEPSSSSANAAVDQGVTNSVANIGPHVLPLTVVPKLDSIPLVSLKAQEASQRFFILALVLALLSAVTVIVWRHHRRDYASPRRIGRRI